MLKLLEIYLKFTIYVYAIIFPNNDTSFIPAGTLGGWRGVRALLPLAS